MIRKLSLFVWLLLSLAALVRAQAPEPHLSEEDVETFRLQIFLDREGFGPGVVDGKRGWVTDQALALYRRRHAEAPEGEAFAKMLAEQVPAVLKTAIVPKDAGQYVDAALSDERLAQSQRASMPYRSLLEYMAERYHTTEAVLESLNAAKVGEITLGAVLVVPSVEPFRIEELPREDYAQDALLSGRHIYIDTGQNRLSIYDYAEDRDEWQILASFPVTPGRAKSIRYGEWTMKTCVPWPDWRYDQTFLDTGERSDSTLVIPSGPNNPVGILWAGLSRAGIGIHGTDRPRSIGRSRSSGCIRMSNWDVARLPDYVRPGARVVIR